MDDGRLCNAGNYRHSYDHVAGDEVLKQTAARLKAIFRDSDYVVRWGGEEFVATARFINRRDAEKLAQRIVEDIEATPFDLAPGAKATITCSVGFVCFPIVPGHESNNHMFDMFTAADHCLYAAKDAGRNTWVGVLNVKAIDSLPLPSSMQALQQLADSGEITLSMRI